MDRERVEVTGGKNSAASSSKPVSAGGSLPSRLGSLGTDFSTLPMRALRLFLIVDAAILAMFATVTALGLPANKVAYALFSLDIEANPGAWYQSMQLLLVGLVFFLLASNLLRGHTVVRRLRHVWLILGAGFVYLSADEAGVIHERLSQLMMTGIGGRPGLVRLFGGTPLASHIPAHIHGGGLWLILYMVVGLVVVAVLAPSFPALVRRWPRECIAFVIGFLVLFTGGAIFEGIAGMIHMTAATRAVEVGFEEGFEMLGQSICIFAAVWFFSSAARELAAGTANGEDPA